MWGRVLQIIVACWLAASPAIFGHTGTPYLANHDYVSAAVIALLALGSFHPRLKHLHLLTALPAFWMIGVAFFAVESPPPPAYQNHVILGLFLLLIALVPSNANQPPRYWSEYQNDHGSESIESGTATR